MILIDENLKSESAMFLELRQQRCRARLEPKSELKNLSTTIKLTQVCVLIHVCVYTYLSCNSAVTFCGMLTISPN